MIKIYDATLTIDWGMVNRLDYKTRKRFLFRAGMYTRTVMKRGLKRRRPGIRTFPGKPPQLIPGKEALKNLIWVHVEDLAEFALIGPLKAAGTTGNIPGALEQGGVIMTDEGPVHVHRHPFALPSLHKSTPAYQRFTEEAINHTYR